MKGKHDDIMETIAHIISRELRAKLELAEFCGLLFDGFKDIAKTVQEIVYIVTVFKYGDFMLDFLDLLERNL